MAARKRRTELNQKWRDKIKTSMLINRLQEHALMPLYGKRVVKSKLLEKSQIAAIEILLRKTMPDLNRTTLDGDDENPVTFSGGITVVPVRPAKEEKK